MPFPLAYDPDEQAPAVTALRRAWGLEFDAAIHRDDSMFRHAIDRRQGSRELALFEYFRSGFEAAELTERLLRHHLGTDLAGRRVLELGCGFGRVTRFLRPRLGEAELFSAELEPGALEFQADRFGADRPVSSRDPEDLAAAGVAFDAILAHSVFSHLPPRLFDAWLRSALDALTPEGILLFSVHSHEERPLDVPPAAEGFTFVPHSESTVLAGEDYGTSWVSPSYVEPRLPRDVRHLVAPKGLWRLQDLHLVLRSRSTAADPARLEQLLHRPDGILDGCRLEEAHRLRIEGWALGCDPTRAPIVEIRVDGSVRWSGTPTGPRPDVTVPRGLDPSTLAGFRVELDGAGGRLGSRSLLEVRARDASGSTLLHCGPVDATTLWLRAAVLEDRLRRTEVALASWEEGVWGTLRRLGRRLRRSSA